MACKLCEGEYKCEEEIKVSFCPKCKSLSVKYVFGIGNLFGVIPQMKCSDCGCSASGFPILVTNNKLLTASKKKNLKINKIKGGKK